MGVGSYKCVPTSEEALLSVPTLTVYTVRVVAWIL